jgi:small subunit ribosomal protein S20
MAGKKTVRHKSALKAARQALRHQARNRAALSQVKTAVKNLRTALNEKTENKADLQKKLAPMLGLVQKTLMTAAQKKIVKKETASRKIARLSKAVHQATHSA